MNADEYLTYQPQPKNQTGLKFNRLLRKFKVNRADLACILMLVAGGIYLTITQPVFISTLGCSTIVWMGIWRMLQTAPILEKWLGIKVRFWHIASAIVTITAVLNVVSLPAQAIFLSGLQVWMEQLATDAGAAGGGTAVDPATIGLIFNAIRAVFLLLVAAAALFAYNQSQQGNDYRPIVTQIALAFGIVIALDVITFLFIGSGYSPSGGGGGGGGI